VQAEDNLLLAKLIRQVFIEYNAPQNGTVYSDPTTDDLYTLFKKDNAIVVSSVFSVTLPPGDSYLKSLKRGQI